MTVVENLLARKHLLLKRLEDDPGQQERDEIEGLLAQIDTSLDFLDKKGNDEPLVSKTQSDIRVVLAAKSLSPIRSQAA